MDDRRDVGAPVDDLLARADRERRGGGQARAAEEYQIIRFVAGGRPFAVPIEGVERTERVPTITPVPRAPAFVRGVASLRGGIVCVVDLHRLLTEQAAPAGDARSLLVLQDHSGRRLGVLSGSLPDFERVRRDQTLRAPAAEVDVYHGAVERDAELVGVLDPTKLFDHLETLLGDGGA
ncbi:MAG: chemotaxis protein CheW [Planctomycetes bacterium]|nr:chemotaxis protein CheW [Planctomycetota bacterium]